MRVGQSVSAFFPGMLVELSVVPLFEILAGGFGNPFALLGTLPVALHFEGIALLRTLPVVLHFEGFALLYFPSARRQGTPGGAGPPQPAVVSSTTAFTILIALVPMLVISLVAALIIALLLGASGL